MKNFWLSWIIIVFCVRAFSGTEAVCNDLQKLTCAPGSYDDGTGSASNPTLLSNAESATKLQVAKLAHDNFLKVLKVKDNSYFRKEVLSATGLSLSPACQGADDKPSSECLANMADGVTDIFMKQHPSVGGYTKMNGIWVVKSDLEDITFMTDSQIYKDTAHQVISQSQELLHMAQVDQRAKDTFSKVIKILIQKVDQMVGDPKVRKNLEDKLTAIRYTSSDCSGDSGYGESVPELLRQNAFYQPTNNTFTYCAGLDLQNTSQFHMAFAISHELMHSMDPCDIAKGPSDFTFKYNPDNDMIGAENEYPFHNLINCLRSADSVGAHIPYSGNNGYNSSSYQSSKSSQASGSAKFGGFCGNDQINEAVADWMASEVTPEYIENNFPNLTTEQKRIGYSNIWRSECEDEATQLGYESKGDPHPKQTLRNNRMILVQPKIRAQMGCGEMPATGVYCKVTHDQPEASGDTSSKQDKQKSSSPAGVSQ